MPAFDPSPQSASPRTLDLRRSWSLTADQALTALAVDQVGGLAQDEAARRLRQFGPNRLVAAAQSGWLVRLARQFNSLVIWILVVAAVISGGLGEWADTAAILAIVVVNGILGFVQEERAQQSLAALQKLSAPSAKVRRDRAIQSISASDLVPGDVILVEAGDHIPADARLLDGFGLAVNESALTGESQAVLKDAEMVLDPAVVVGDRLNCLFMGASVAAGKGTAAVFATGMATELGQIAGLLREQPREPTPLERRLDELGRVLAIACLALVSIIYVLRMARGGPPLDIFLSAVSLAVAAVPEGLPAVVTLALALGLQRMVRRNALIRRLPSVETLGSVTVICSDKTGTLTRNEMTVREVVTASGRFRVQGAGYQPTGGFIPLPSAAGNGQANSPGPESAGGSDAAIDPQREPDLLELLTIGARCNDARVTPGAGGGPWTALGDPTEAAVLVAAMKAGVSASALGERRLHEIPFDSQRQAMSVVAARDDDIVMYAKGAPEALLRHSTSVLRQGAVEILDDEARQHFLAAAAEMAGRAMRVLGFAERRFADSGEEFVERELTFVGLAGMIDPPRSEARSAVERCRSAGIRPVMITGDHPGTGAAISAELGILGSGERVLTGAEMNQIDDESLRMAVKSTSVYARVSAEHKQRIVAALKAGGEIVAMTGDGVNDAPAVQAADIGIAMGITGSDVTKAAADMVLTDDNFASIVSAVEEGRGIFDNIQKVVLFLLSCNAGEVLFMFITALLGWPVPLTPIQLLWINLVTDGPPALGLVMEPPEPDIMGRAPRSLAERVISWRLALRILWHGALVAGASLAAFVWRWSDDPQSLDQARTMAFAVMAFCQLFLAVGCRSQTHTMPELGFWTNRHLLWAIGISCGLQIGAMAVPRLRDVFDASPLGWLEWGTVLLLSIIPATVVEVRKLVSARLASQQKPS